jgi:UDP-glucose 4-epimerase
VLGYFRVARICLPVPGRGERRYSLVYAPDLADGLLRAAQTPCPSGEIFHLTGPALTWAAFGRRIAAALGRPARVLALPEAALRLGGRAADLWARLRGRPGIFSSQKVMEMLAAGWVASPDKAARMLGWTAATDLDTALAETVAWYRNHGWL